MNQFEKLELSHLGHPAFSKSPAETTIVVGMSGGVDSSVCAVFLKESGFNVIGLFMKNWEEEDENGVCQASKEYADVEAVCELYQIPCYSVNFVKEYRDQVFADFLEKYQRGEIPNPDILCNREIKFNVFYQKAMQLGADFLATGHYCQNVYDKVSGEHQLYCGVDKNKDQSYFLYTIQADILSKVIFPIGHLKKSQVREMAEYFKLPTSQKKDSTGICFIGERNFKNFLSQYLAPKQGDFCLLDGTVVGQHQGAQFYTPGQRKGLGLGGPGAPWFVISKDIDKNIVYVERGEHPALYTRTLFCHQLSWVSKNPPDFPLECTAKIRYRQEMQQCRLEWDSQFPDRLQLSFSSPQRAACVGQSVVFYQHNKCLGGGVISELGESELTISHRR